MRLPTTIGIIALFLLAGCGGGGSGGSSGVAYTGSMSQAVIADNNAEAIAIGAYQAGERSSNLTGSMSASPGAAAAGSPRTVTLVRALTSVANRLAASATSGAATGAAVAPKEIIPFHGSATDPLGGTMVIDLSADNVTGAFTGSITFENWHPDNNTVMNGAAYASGQFDTSTWELTNILFTFVSLTMEDAAASVTVGGTVALATSPSSASATIDLVFRDNVTGKTVWIQDYTMTVANGPDTSPADGTADYIDVSISGRIYLHDYGYVDIDTPVPLRIDADAMNPSSGTLRMTGSAGRSVQLVVIDDVTGFDLEADLEPDDVYEWTSPGHPWE